MEIEAYRTLVRTLIQDGGNQFFSAEEVDAGLRQALLDYNEANPHGASALLSLAEGGIIPLSGLPAGACVTRLYYPWDAALPLLRQERNRVLFWETTASLPAALRMETSGSSLPAAGENVRIHYALPHTIAGLDGAAQTSLPDGHAELIGRGAAGYTLLAGTADRAELLERSTLERLGKTLLESYRLLLEEVAKSAQRAGSAVLQWRGMDKFDFVQ